MKLTDFDKPINTVLGQEAMIALGDAGNGDKPRLQRMTIKVALLMCLGAMRPAPGVDAIRVYKLGTELLAAKKQLEVEGEDIRLLKAAVTQNALGYACYTIAQLTEYLDSQCKE